MRELIVAIDDLPEQIVMFGDSASFDVPAGEHQARVTNRLFTKRMTLYTEPDETVFLQGANVGGGCFAATLIMGGTGAYRVSLERF